MRGAASSYSWRYPLALVALLQHHQYRIAPFMREFWQTSDFYGLSQRMSLHTSAPARTLILFVYMCSLVQIVVGLGMMWQWYDAGTAGWWAFGLALIISYPVVSAVVIAVPVWLSYATRPRYVGRRILTRIFVAQVLRLRKQHSFKIVCVVGSVGKTSTKVAIAKALGRRKRVLWQEGNYNVDLTVPLVLFSQPLPSLFNIVAWARIWLQNQRTIRQPYPYDVVVLELGTDAPGQIADFAYLRPDIAVVTAIAPEHMEFFGTIDEVAREELAVFDYAKVTLVNIDDTDSKYLQGKDYISYGLSSRATYFASKRLEKGLRGQRATFNLDKDHSFVADIPMLGAPGAKAATAAVAVAHLLGESNEDIEKGLVAVTAFSGRMRLFEGIKQSTLLDDTYNASPISVRAALDAVYAADSPQRIAILGTMNELGAYTQSAHQEVGAYCDPSKLTMVVTIGSDAQEYLAPAAKDRGCTVYSFDSPYAAGEFVKKKLKKGALVLAKGSQNRVFAEEALKILLANKADAADMVRQSNYWLSIKRQQFEDFH